MQSELDGRKAALYYEDPIVMSEAINAAILWLFRKLTDKVRISA